MNGYSTRTFTGLLAGVGLPLFLAGCPTEDELTGQVPPPPSSGATDGNDPPSIEGSPPAVVEVGVNYSFTPQASDPDDDPLTFSVENLPDWLEFDETDGSLEGVPPEGSEGSYTDIVITVSDGAETDSLPAFTITVEPASEDNLPPEISGNPRRTATVGETWSFTPNASDPDGDPLTYSVQNAPSWTQFDSSNGRLSGVPQASDEGRYQGISITVSDGVSTASLPAVRITGAAGARRGPLPAHLDHRVGRRLHGLAAGVHDHRGRFRLESAGGADDHPGHPVRLGPGTGSGDALRSAALQPRGGRGARDVRAQHLG